MKRLISLVIISLILTLGLSSVATGAMTDDAGALGILHLSGSLGSYESNYHGPVYVFGSEYIWVDLHWTPSCAPVLVAVVCRCCNSVRDLVYLFSGSGYFEFHNLPQGSYDIMIRNDGNCTISYSGAAYSGF